MSDKTNSIKEERFEPEQIRGALETAKGNVSMAARLLSTNRTTLYDYLNRYPALKTILRDARETMIDNAETALHAAALKGEGWAVCFMLKTVGRNRGYIEKHEVVITDEREVAEAVIQQYLTDNPDSTRLEAVEFSRKFIPEVDKLASELIQ